MKAARDLCPSSSSVSLKSLNSSSRSDLRTAVAKEFDALKVGWEDQ
jgi:hypothetical protein